MPPKFVDPFEVNKSEQSKTELFKDLWRYGTILEDISCEEKGHIVRKTIILDEGNRKLYLVKQYDGRSDMMTLTPMREVLSKL